MISEERRALILNELNQKRYVQVSDLANALDVSTVTIRRDLDVLEKSSLCTRTHGGAIRVNPGVTLEMPFDLKRHEMSQQKERIARAALDWIDDGDTFILDAGSTTYTLALLLNTKVNITVVTNDLKIAVLLAENPKVYLICTGGLARSSVFSLEGVITESFIKTLRVDKTFLGADAVHPDGSISNVNIQEVAIKQGMIRAADKVILLADSSKFKKAGFVKICDLQDIDVIITDDGISEEVMRMLTAKDVEMIVV